jgi:hypothetical protein
MLLYKKLLLMTFSTTLVFYMIDKGAIPSIQYKMSFRGPKSMRKVQLMSVRVRVRVT